MGRKMKFKIEKENFYIQLTDEEKLDVNILNSFVVSPECGAIASFHGTTRNSSKDGKVCVELQYSAYPEMALNQLELIIKETIAKYGLHRVAVSHHIGTVPPLEAGVLVSVSCKHRKNAFLGCAEIMDLLKAKVPIWKKEIYDDDSSKWIHNCT